MQIQALHQTSVICLYESALICQHHLAYLAETGCITVIVHDNGSLHTSNLAKQRWQEWQEKGLFIFFLPPYCSEMNRIEEEWHQLKTHEIAGQMFDNNYDLAMTIIDGMEARSIKGEYALERLIFNCA
nr:transposase [Tolypothrix sp. NIES-4075]